MIDQGFGHTFLDPLFVIRFHFRMAMLLSRSNECPAVQDTQDVSLDERPDYRIDKLRTKEEILQLVRNPIHFTMTYLDASA